MSTNEVTQEVTPEVTEEKSGNKKKKKWLLLLLLLLLLIVVGVGVAIGIGGKGGKASISASQLEKLLAQEGEATITLDGDITVSKELVVNGQKTIEGSGSIILAEELEGEWPEEGKNNSWGMGCAQLKAEDTDGMAAILSVSDGATLTLGGKAVIDAGEYANAIEVTDGGSLVIKGDAVVKNGRYANIVVAKGAALEVAGGTIMDGLVYGIINKGTLTITDGTLSGGKTGSIVYTEGTAAQSGGTITDSKVHNVYVAAGTFTMTGGVNEGAAKDGVAVAEGASASIEGGDISNCNHSLCNNGEMEVGAITLKESGIMNYATGTLTLNGTTVDTSAVYCLANNGGTVIANDFSALKCDTCAIYNFSGTMELNNVTVEDSRDGNIANAAGNLTVNGGTLGECNDKSIVVGNGKAVFDDVTLEGTSREKYGVYVFGGEMYMTNSSLHDISSTAFKVDAGGYIEIKDITMKDIAQNAFQCEGGIVVAEDITIETLGSHCIYNKGGDITVTNMTVTDIKKNAIQHKDGTTTVTNLQADTIGNHGGYVEVGTVTVTDSSFKNMGGNGFYIVAGENELNLKGVTIDTTKDQGLNVSSKVNVEDVTICNTSKNGIYNKTNGVVNAKNVTIYNTGDHGISNVSVMTVTGVSIKDTGKEKNSVQNTGTMTITNAVLENSDNHGVYNTGNLNGASITVKNTAKNGLYNAQGNCIVDGLSIDGTKEHGVNNAATLNVSNLTVANTGDGKNNIQNSGKMDVAAAVLTNSKNHGVYNTGTLTGKDITVKQAAVNGIYNAEGTLTVDKLTVDGVGEHGINNAATLTVSNVTVANTGAGKNSIQNIGTADVTTAVLKNSKNHGVYNTGTFNGKDITVKDAAVNGIYNAEGKLTVDKLTVDGVGEHGINNAATLTASNITITNTGAGKNSVQNSGTANITSATLSNSKNHGIYNTGTLVGKDVTVKNAAVNGIYNTAGSIEVNGLNIDGAGEHGINNEASVTVTNASIANTGAGKNSIQNSGTVTLTTALLKASKNHGIYNTGTLSGSDITVVDPAKNGVYNDGGTVTGIDKLTVKNAGDQAINNTGKLTATNVSIDTTVANGIYNNGGTLTVDKADIKNTGEHGVNNVGTMTITNAVITTPGSGKNGIQNTGNITANEITISDSENHGIYNNGVLNSTGTITISDIAKIGIYNYNDGDAALATVVMSDIGGHGVNNSGIFAINNVTITNAGTDGSNGIQNTGDMTVSAGATVTDSGKHGLYNGGTFEGNKIVITNTGDLGLSNSGEMKVYGLDISGKASKAVYNSGYAELYTATIDGTDISNTSAEYLVDNNGGVLDLVDTTLKNAKGTALHNRGNAAASVTNVIINTAGNYGTFVESGSSLSGDGLEINNITKGIDGAEGMPIKNAGKITMLDHVTIGSDDPEVTGSGAEVETELKEIVNNAVVNDAATASYSGYDLVINNATGGCAIYNKGIVFVTDFAAANPKDGIVSRYTGWATLSGTIAVTNASRNPITTYGDESKGYKNGITLTAGSTMVLDGAGSHAINNKGTFEAAADSNITIKNVVGENINAINNNKGTMALGNVTIDGVVVTVTMYNDSTINSNSGNGIQTSGPLTLNGHVEISNLYHAPANDKTDNSNGSGVVVKNGGSITGDGSITINGTDVTTIDDVKYQGLYNGIFITKCSMDIAGDIVIDNAKNQGIYVADANAYLGAGNITISNVEKGHGIYVNNASGKVETTGTITVTDMPGGRGLYNLGTMNIGGDVNINGTANNGIETSGKIAVTGDVTIDMKDVAKRGIYIKGKDANLTAANVSVSNTGDNAIEVDGTGSNKSSLVVPGNVVINNTANGKKGININGANASATVGNLTVNYAGENAVYINDAKGTLTAGTITVTFPGKRGISNAGIINAENIVVTDLTGALGSYYPIENSGTITVSGDVTVARVVDAAGIRNKGIMTVNGTTTITDISGTKNVNGIQQDGGKTLNLNNVVISNVTQTASNPDGDGVCIHSNGIYNKGTINLSGTATISNIKNTAATTDTEAVGVVNVGTIKGTGSLVISDTGKAGVYNSGTISLASVSVSDAGARGIHVIGDNASLTAEKANVSNTGNTAIEVDGTGGKKGTLTVIGDVTINGTASGTKGINVNGAGAAATVGNLSISNAGENALYINNAGGTLTASGTITIDAPGKRGISSKGTINAGTIVVKNLTGANGNYNAIENSGTINVAGDTTVESIVGGCGVYNTGTIQGQGTLKVDGIATSGKYGISNSAGTISYNAISVCNTVDIGIFMESKAVLESYNVTVDTAGGQGIQLNHANTLTVETLTVKNITKNGLRLYNNSSNPTVTIGTLIAENCGEYGLASQKALTSDNLTVGLLQYKSCGKGAKHGNIKSGVAAVEEMK